MPGPYIIAFSADARAEDIRGLLRALQDQHLFDLGAAALAVKQVDSVAVTPLDVAAPDRAGGPWDRVVALVAIVPVGGSGPAEPDECSLERAGVDDAAMAALTATLEHGQAALFMLLCTTTADGVVRALRSLGVIGMSGPGGVRIDSGV